jgi:hypothetical protein
VTGKAEMEIVPIKVKVLLESSFFPFRRIPHLLIQ